jgi:hypothetical protein
VFFIVDYQMLRIAENCRRLAEGDFVALRVTGALRGSYSNLYCNVTPD